MAWRVKSTVLDQLTLLPSLIDFKGGKLMKMIRGTLKLALILYICAALSGVYVLSASAANYTRTQTMIGTVLIEIVKGDTLWGPLPRASQRSTPVAAN